MKIELEVEVGEDEEHIDYRFKSSEPVSLRNFCYYMAEAISEIINDWEKKGD